MENRIKFSHVLLCVGLIAAGCAGGWFLIWTFLIDMKAWYLSLLALLPSLPLLCILPIYGGVSYLIDMFKKKEE